MSAEGIKESLELVAMVKELAKALEASKADGKIDWKDLPKFAPVVMAASKAASGGHLIPLEVKDLTAEEGQLLVGELIDAVTRLVYAVIK